MHGGLLKQVLLLAIVLLCLSHLPLVISSSFDDEEEELSLPENYDQTSVSSERPNAWTIMFDELTGKRMNVSKAQFTHSTLMIRNDDGSRVFGNVVVVKNAAQHVAVLPPAGGCGKKSTLGETARAYEAASGRHCQVLLNAGLFNTKTNACLGSVVSDGVLVQTDPVSTTHFGITHAGEQFLGYLAPFLRGGADLRQSGFNQLVSGMVPLIRDGQVLCSTASCAPEEEMHGQETGDRSTFINIQSARSAVAYRRNGDQLQTHFPGKSFTSSGVSQPRLAEILHALGAWQAVNLDGGGSAQLSIAGRWVGASSDDGVSCNGMSELNPYSTKLDAKKVSVTCERPVSTVLCVFDERKEIHIDTTKSTLRVPRIAKETDKMYQPPVPVPVIETNEIYRSPAPMRVPVLARETDKMYQPSLATETDRLSLPPVPMHASEQKGVLAPKITEPTKSSTTTSTTQHPLLLLGFASVLFLAAIIIYVCTRKSGRKKDSGVQYGNDQGEDVVLYNSEATRRMRVTDADEIMV